MSPLIWFMLIASGMLLLAVTAIGFMFLGWYASRKPAMSFEIIDYSDVPFSGFPVVRHIKYHPTDGHFHEPVEGPMGRDYVRLVEKQGPFGWRHVKHTWERARVLPPSDKRNGCGTYMADVMDIKTRAALDRLVYDNGVKAEVIADLTGQVQELKRDVQGRVMEQVDEVIKQIQKTMPFQPSKGLKGRGGQQ